MEVLLYGHLFMLCFFGGGGGGGLVIRFACPCSYEFTMIHCKTVLAKLGYFSCNPRVTTWQSQKARVAPMTEMTRLVRETVPNKKSELSRSPSVPDFGIWHYPSKRTSERSDVRQKWLMLPGTAPEVVSLPWRI